MLYMLLLLTPWESGWTFSLNNLLLVSKEVLWREDRHLLRLAGFLHRDAVLCCCCGSTLLHLWCGHLWQQRLEVRIRLENSKEKTDHRRRQFMVMPALASLVAVLRVQCIRNHYDTFRKHTDTSIVNMSLFLLSSVVKRSVMKPLVGRLSCVLSVIRNVATGSSAQPVALHGWVKKFIWYNFFF